MVRFSSVFRDFPVLETRRFLLREVERSDAADLFAVFADDEVTRFYNLPTFTSLDQAEQLISRMRQRFATQRAIRWAIARKADGRVLGTCGYTEWWPYFYKASVGYELGRPYWRQGVMSEVLSEILAFGFKKMDLNRVEALIMPGNVASERLVEKLGFVREGLLREYGYWEGKFHDLEIFAILRRDYHNIR